MGSCGAARRCLDSVQVKRFLLAVAAGLCVAVNAFASFPATSVPPSTEYAYRTGPNGSLSASGFYSTPAAACQQSLTITQAANPGITFTFVSAVSGSCNYSTSSGGAQVFTYPGTTRAGALYTCPSGSTLSGSTCACNSPLVENGAGACVSVEAAACDSAALVDSAAFGSRDIQIPGKVSSGSVCMPTAGVAAGRGCSVAFSRSASYQLASGSWVSEGTYSRSVGGGVCETAAPAPGVPPAEPDTCKNGQAGQVNGVTVCIPFSGPSESGKTKAIEKPSVDGPVSETSTTTTVCSGNNSCTSTTTTTTSVNGGAATSKTESVTQDKGAYCQSNPSSAECGMSSPGGTKFSGSCVSGFVGEGDALQKATAEAVNKTNCLLDAGVALDGVKAALEAGTFGTELPTKAKNFSEFDQTNPLGSACPADMSVSIMSSIIVFPFSQACWALQALGYIAVAFTLLYSTIFVVKGF